MTTAGKPRRAVVSYEQAHLRLKTWRGRPDTMHCVQCGDTAAHWAYLGGDPDELFDKKGRAYSLDLARYAPMCVPCHFRKDRAAGDGRPENVCPRGHEWTEQNTGIRKKRGPTTGLRFCKACNREKSAEWRERQRAAGLTRRGWVETLLAATTAHVARTDPTYTRPSSVVSPSGGEMTPPSTGLAAGAGGAGAPVGGFPPSPRPEAPEGKQR